MRILVTGASGFVGSRLIPALLHDGHEVRAMGRDRGRLAAALGDLADSHALELVEGDALAEGQLTAALEGVDLAYYLIHSMERTDAGSTFQARERRAAENFAAAAAGAGVGRVIYLGGLVPHWDAGAARSRHLDSRKAVEGVLAGRIDDCLILRASIVIGARSRSFRLLVRLVERMPLIPLPAWQRHRTQPIDERDVIAMLVAAAGVPNPGVPLELGGPDILTYGEIVERIADAMLLGRPSLRLGVGLTGITARVAAAIAGEQPELVGALMEGLQGDLLAGGPDASALLGVQLHSFDAAVEHALGEWERDERLAAR